ncbi:hypothetical protein [Salinigranum sp. GCM10025319]|uniref:hypothetical protein n=1 Tax=Salinigranum sp. GCM10025319 TaxID=3252687 RepID=UPI003622E93F
MDLPLVATVTVPLRFVVLPRSQVAAHRLGAIRRDWALSTAASLLVLAPVVAVGSTLV